MNFDSTADDHFCDIVQLFHLPMSQCLRASLACHDLSHGDTETQKSKGTRPYAVRQYTAIEVDQQSEDEPR